MKGATAEARPLPVSSIPYSKSPPSAFAGEQRRHAQPRARAESRWRRTGIAERRQQRVRHPLLRYAAGGVDSPDRALERIGNIDVAQAVESHRIEAARAGGLGEHRSSSALFIDSHHARFAEVDDEQLAGQRMKVGAEQEGARVRDLQLALELALRVDADDNIWVTANQADEIVVVDKSGRAIAKLGDFDGVRQGATVGLLLPASLALRDGWLYITNLALDLRLAGAGQAVDSQWAAQVSSHTISRLRARIPPRLHP